MYKKRMLAIALITIGLLLFTFLGVASARQVADLNPMQLLGKSIFFDEALSVNQNQDCGACHAAETGWTGPVEAFNLHGAVYEGSIPGRFGARKPPSSGYATFSPIFHLSEPKNVFVGGNFWDGRATGMKLGNPAADQAQGPFLNPLEQANPDSACVVYKVCTATTYPVSFEDVWGTSVCDITWPADIDVICATEGTAVPLSDEDRATSNTDYDKIALTIASFEASSEVNAFTSKFDYSLKGKAKLSKLERKGYALFKGKAGCSGCHPVSGPNSLFTDFTYDNLGVPKNPENPVYNTNPGFIDLGLGGYLKTTAEYAQFATENYGKFKVPTLRNVDLRPSPDFVKAYGHNGFFKSLEEIVHFYNTRDVLPHCEDISNPQVGVNCWPEPEYAATVNMTEVGNLGLSANEEKALVAFLKTLSDGYIPKKK